MEKKCKFSGLSIFEDPEFLNTPVGSDYFVSMSMIGDSIFFAKFSGNLSKGDVAQINQKRDQFLDRFFIHRNLNPAEQKVVDIRDCSQIKGSPDYRNKLEQKKFFFNPDNRLLAYINCAFPPLLNLLYKVGLYLFKLSVPVKFCKNQENAINLAREILEKSNSKQQTTIKNGDYGFKEDSTVFTSRIVENNILISRFEGEFKEKHIRQISDIYFKIYQLKEFEVNQHYLVMDLTCLRGKPLPLVVKFMKMKNKVNHVLNVNPVNTLVITTSKLLMSTITLFRKFHKSQAFFVSNLNEAMDFIKFGIIKGNSKNNQKKLFMGNQDVEKLLKFIGEITWDIEGKDLEYGQSLFSKNHPLTKIAHAVTILGDEVKSLIQSEAESVHKIKKQNDHLREEVAKRQKIEIELRAAKKRAESASMAKSTFLANMSHELRTPLNGIIGFSDLLDDSQQTKEQQEFIKNIKISANALYELVNNVLDFSKIEAGKLELEYCETNLNELITEVMVIHKPTAEEKGIQLFQSVSNDLPEEIFTDPVRLKQILSNILSNAIKFTLEGSVELLIEKDQKSSKYECGINFMVRDTGIGIELEKQKKIFESFSQADNSTTRKFGGTGLGLSIVNSLVTKMGGQMDLTSQSGAGSTFSIALTSRQPFSN